MVRDMSDVAGLTYELLKRMQADLADVKREQLSMGSRLASIEQHLAANQVEIARLSGDVAHIKGDLSTIKRRLDLVDA
jgi:septal ring factor EnvC (AmiA/AmiB activator)